MCDKQELTELMCGQKFQHDSKALSKGLDHKGTLSLLYRLDGRISIQSVDVLLIRCVRILQVIYNLVIVQSYIQIARK